uniref:Lipocalin n=1 Tax=Timema bartmani TaxID=61472 RepID=A0A7R9F5U0_9NEOP|nr:unnamed protein product [Timema bartmani]
MDHASYRTGLAVLIISIKSYSCGSRDLTYEHRHVLSTFDRDSNPDLLIIGSHDYCESDAGLDHLTTDAAIMTRMSCTIFTPVLLVMVKVIQGQVAVKGHCPEVTTVDNFDVSRKGTVSVSTPPTPLKKMEQSKYLTRTITRSKYQNELYPFRLAEWSKASLSLFSMTSCSTARLPLHLMGFSAPFTQIYSFVNVIFHCYSSRRYTSATGKATLASKTGEGKLSVSFGVSVLFDVAPISAPYWVLGTDYTSYSVVWSCVDAVFLNLSTYPTRFSWLLTREKNPGPEVLRSIEGVLNANNLKDLPYTDTAQTC